MKIGAQIGILGKLDDALKYISTAGLKGLETFAIPWLNKSYDPKEIRSLLSKFNVTLSGAYHAGDFITPEIQNQELKRATDMFQLLRAVNGEFLILHSGSASKEGGYPLSAYDQLADTMNKIAKIGRKHGVKVACHPHAGTMVETRKELDLLMDRLDPDLVGLCPHAAHFINTGSDPYDIYKTYAHRVVYVHVSDMTGVDKVEEASRLIRQGKDRKEVYKNMGIRQTNLGQGEIDQRALMEPLLKAGFDGWVIIEGKDPESTPLEAIQMSAKYLKKEFRNKFS